MARSLRRRAVRLGDNLAFLMENLDMCYSSFRRVITVALSAAALVFGAPTSASGDELVPPAVEHRALTLGGQPLWQAMGETSTLFAQTTPQGRGPAPRGRNHGLYWGGIALAGVGAWLTLWGLEPYAEVACVQEGNGPLEVFTRNGTRLALEGECTPRRHLDGQFWTGVGMLALGSTFAIMGASASVQPGAMRISKTLTF